MEGRLEGHDGRDHFSLIQGGVAEEQAMPGRITEIVDRHRLHVDALFQRAAGDFHVIHRLGELAYDLHAGVILMDRQPWLEMLPAKLDEMLLPARVKTS